MTEDVVSGSVRGTIHLPDAPSGGVVLSHGAGSDRNSRLLIGLAEAFAASGIAALRIDLPFRQARTGPPHPGIAERDRLGIREAAEYMKQFGTVLLAGHSYGGRQSSMLAAEDQGVAAGLALFSYPLHPPKKPEQLRTAHFTALGVPALFIHGTRDPFGSPDELQAAVRLIPARTQVMIVENAAHELKPVIAKPGAFVDQIVEYFAVTSAT